MMQRQSIAYDGSFSLLEFHLSQLAGEVKSIRIEDKHFLQVFKEITIKLDGHMLVLEVSRRRAHACFGDEPQTRDF